MNKAPQGAIAYLQRLYYDTAISATPYQLSSLREDRAWRANI